MRCIKRTGQTLTVVAFLFCGYGSSAGSTQFLPNMGQQITPLAPVDSRFEMLNPDLTDRPTWLAGQAVTSVLSGRLTLAQVR